ncbi:MAG: hypothetical protein ABIP89_11845 [Polyangiaceae bacterium]
MIRLPSLLVALSILTGGCSSTSPGGAVGASDASNMSDAQGPTPDGGAPGSACATLPASAQKSGTGCTGQPGTFTEDTYDTVAGTYDETCGATPYKDQAAFDANEGTSGAAGTTIMSNEDYVVTTTCASGSIAYQASGSAKTKIVFIWTKVP